MIHTLLYPFHKKSKQQDARSNIFDAGKHYTLQVDAVGFKSDDILLSATQNTIKINAKSNRIIPEGYTLWNRQPQSHTEINRHFRFAEDIDSEGITATITNGLLSVRIPKKEAQKINITVH